MSEAPDETQTDEPEPETTETPTPDEQEAEQEEAEQTPAQAAAKDGSDEIPKKLERAITDQRKRLSKIVGVDLAGQECPTCDGMGYTVGGVGDAPDIVHPDNLVACEYCNGYGQVETGSRNPDHIHTICTKCGGLGYQTIAAQPSNVSQLPTPTSSAAQPVMGFLNPDGSFAPFGVNTPQSVEQGA